MTTIEVIRLCEPVSFRSLTSEEKAARKAIDMNKMRKNARALERRLRSPATRKRADGLMRQFGRTIALERLLGTDRTIVSLSRGERSRPMAY